MGADEAPPAAVSRHVAALRERDAGAYLLSLAPQAPVIVDGRALPRDGVEPRELAAAWGEVPAARAPRFGEPRPFAVLPAGPCGAGEAMVLGNLPEEETGVVFAAAFGLAGGSGAWRIAWAGLYLGEPLLTRWFRSLLWGKTFTYPHGLVGGRNDMALIHRVMERQLRRWGPDAVPALFWRDLFATGRPRARAVPAAGRRTSPRGERGVRSHGRISTGRTEPAPVLHGLISPRGRHHGPGPGRTRRPADRGGLLGHARPGALTIEPSGPKIVDRAIFL